MLRIWNLLKSYRKPLTGFKQKEDMVHFILSSLFSTPGSPPMDQRFKNTKWNHENVRRWYGAILLWRKLF